MSSHDIVFFAGEKIWDPENKSLDGSEQSIVFLSSSLTKMGKSVAVYGGFPDKNFNDVDYYNFSNFSYENNYDIVIIWRLFGLSMCSLNDLKANKIYLDAHDTFSSEFVEKWNQYNKLINKIFFKSDYHKQLFDKATNQNLSKELYTIIPNGVRVESFSINKYNTKRNPYRFCYCSSYTKGLAEILQYVWPFIYHFEPRAEFHIYNGMENLYKNMKTLFDQLLSQPGVMEHGKQPMAMIIREKYMSGYHLYITNTPDEIDCVSIKESLVTGCIPLISNFGIFKSREGIHFELTSNTDIECYQNIARKILEVLEQNDRLIGYREQLKKSSLIISWDNVAKEWLQSF
jgi:hypothetical protein